MAGMEHPACPNCRGSTAIVAIWNSIGPRPDPTQGQPNLYNAGSLNGAVELNTIATPRSMVTDYDFNTPDGIHVTTEPVLQPTQPSSQRPLWLPAGTDTEHSFPTFPSSSQDAQDWWESSITFGGNRTSSTTSTTAVPKAAAAAGPNVHTYISNTELADGRQALLVDPGSWSNLAWGSMVSKDGGPRRQKWTKSAAKET